MLARGQVSHDNLKKKDSAFFNAVYSRSKNVFCTHLYVVYENNSVPLNYTVMNRLFLTKFYR